MTWFYQSAPGGGGRQNERALGESLAVQWFRLGDFTVGARSALAVELRSCKLPGKAKAVAAPLGPAPCDPWTVAARALCPCDSPGKNTGVGCHSLLQGLFPTQELNPGLLHCRQLLYHLNHQGSPKFREKNERNVLHHSFFFFP